MKQILVLILSVLVIIVSSLAVTGKSANTIKSDCPLRGTPVCPEYTACCR